MSIAPLSLIMRRVAVSLSLSVVISGAVGCTGSSTQQGRADGVVTNATMDGAGLPDTGPRDVSAHPDGGGPVTMPACAPSPEIYGALKPLWSLAVGAGFLGGVATTSAGNIVVAGSAVGAISVTGKTFSPSNTGGLAGPFVFVLDPTGGLVWHREFNGQGNIDAMGLDSSGDIYIAGDFDVSGSLAPLDLGKGVLQGTFFLAKLGPTGDTLWSKSFQPFRSGLGSEGGNSSLSVDPAGNVTVVGTALAPAVFGGGAADAGLTAGGDSGFIAAFDAEGNLKYNKVYNGAFGAQVALDATGNSFIAGEFRGTLDLGGSLESNPPMAGSAFLAKLSPAGDVLWQLADGSYSTASAVAVSGAGAYVAGTFDGTIGLAGATSVLAGGGLFLAALDGSGNPTLERTIPAEGVSISALASDPTGGLVAAGRVSAYADVGGGVLTPSGVLLAKFDAAGRPVYSARFGVQPYTGLFAGGAAVAVDSGGNAVLAGIFNQAIDLGSGVLAAPVTDFQDIFVARYAPVAGPAISPRAPCPIPIDGGAPDGGRLVAAMTSPPIVDVALGSSSVYWTTGTEVMSATLSGGAPTPVAIGQNGTVGLAIDSRALYWANGGGPLPNGSIEVSALDGGAPTTLAEGQDAPRAIAVDDRAVYWTAGGTTTADGGVTPGAVLSVPLGGGTPTELATGLGMPGPIAAYSGVVVFASRLGPSGSQIASLASDGGVPMQLATTDDPVGSIALDATTVYWIDTGSVRISDFTVDDGRLRSLPLGGGAAATLADKQAGPGKMIVLGPSLFWATGGDSSNAGPSGNAGLWSVATTGGVSVGLVTNREHVGAFAIDATHVAWADTLNDSTGLTGLFVRER